MSTPQNPRLRNLLIANMAVGVAISATAIYFMITGEYADLAARKATEAMLNKLAIGGLLYSAASWYVDQFVRPIWSKSGART